MQQTVHFLPDDIKVATSKGENLLDVAARAGVYIHAFCGGDGVCGKCKVKIEQGEVASNKRSTLSQQEKDQGYHLAC